jgi:flagellum-specific peptidoglycan hydrolase FlgJ
MARTYYHHASMNSKPSNSQSNTLSLQEPVLWKCIILAALTYLVWNDQLSIVLDLSPPNKEEALIVQNGQNIKASLLSGPVARTQLPKKPKVYSKLVLPPETKGHSAILMDPGFAARNQLSSSLAAASTAQCKDYVARFSPVAVAEMHKFGIPASIILAQGLLESNAGDSKLALSTNNHFGIKCFSNRCKKGHCANYSDDSHKDFFVRYSNIWSSYRDHSTFLKNSRRYAHLFKLAPTDYRGWAVGLAKAGYATDKQYAEKLIALIQNLQLYTFDQE